MRFEKIKKGRKDSKVQKLIEEFLKTGYDKVEVFNENDYENDNKMVAAIRWVIKNYYIGQVEVSKTCGRVFLIRIENQNKVAQ